MQKYLHLILLVALTYSASGQKLWQKLGYELEYPVCYASDEVEKSFIPPPAGSNRSLKSAEKLSEIIVTYNNFPTEAREAFEYAVSIWEQLIESPVPIYIQASWGEQEKNTLGSCGPSDFNNNFAGAPYKDVYYPIALAEKILGEELTGPNRPDMIARFNKDINWYFGTDGDTPTTMYDFVSVVLHELGHGFGFTGFYTTLRLTGGYNWWQWGDATIFDHLVENESGEKLTDTTIFDNPSAALRNQLVSNALYADSRAALAMGMESRPRLYAPSTWSEGSSIYHLNDATYPSGSTNALMTHSFSRGEAVHHPGPATLGILADMGWASIIINHTPLQDMEAFEPMQFDVTIESAFALNHDSLFLVYFTDSVFTGADSIPLKHIEDNLYSANLQVGENMKMLSYYISAADSLGRVVTNPAGAPQNAYHVRIGPDLIGPAIDHEPISIFLDTGEDLIVTAHVEDNFAVDTVMVIYAINGMVQPSFGLSHVSGSNYSGSFPFDNTLLEDLDQITYQIIATDASTNQNITRFPENDNINFFIEKIFPPATSYENDFENGHQHFTLNDFEIYTAEGFENGSLHSPHPYPSPNEDNRAYNFTTILKRPIVLKAPAIMEFDEVVLVEPGNEGTQYGDFDFWDYVIAEGSKDNGHTWQPLADGYDSGADTLWKETFQESIADMNSTDVGSSDLYRNRQIDMFENGNFNENDTILIRFRLYSDPYAHGWGWTIDNLKIQLPVTASSQVLSPGNLRVFPNPFSGSFRVLVEPKTPIELLEYDLYNMQGQIVKSLQMKNISGPVTSEITLENGLPGMYFLVVKENGKRVLSKKIIHN